jgi:hypothetical protein
MGVAAFSATPIAGVAVTIVRSSAVLARLDVESAAPSTALRRRPR